jgi:hypothetical protein
MAEFQRLHDERLVELAQLPQLSIETFISHLPPPPRPAILDVGASPRPETTPSCKINLVVKES